MLLLDLLAGVTGLVSVMECCWIISKDFPVSFAIFMAVFWSRFTMQFSRLVIWCKYKLRMKVRKGCEQCLYSCSKVLQVYH